MERIYPKTFDVFLIFGEKYNIEFQKNFRGKKRKVIEKRQKSYRESIYGLDLD